MGAGSLFWAKRNFGMSVERIWISHMVSPLQLTHFGIGSDSGPIKRGSVSRVYLQNMLNI